MRLFFTLVCALVFTGNALAQIPARLMRYMDVSDTQVTFVYGGDIWVAQKAGGTAMQLTHSPGEESWPRFSPDGASIAYSASYAGNLDVYVMPVTGGVPTRVTYQSYGDRMIDWHPDGEHLLFASARESGIGRLNQFYLVGKDGGFPEKLPIPYGELASYSPDGRQLAYITKITENYPFKRYRGGLASDITLFDLEENRAENITNSQAIDGKPAWVGDKIYFLSDQGEHMRLNVWVYDTSTGETTQVTAFEDFDISFLSAGGTDLVFEQGGELYLMDTATQQYEAIALDVASDLSAEMPRTIDVSDRISNVTAGPEGKRVIFEARGELFNVPAKEGFVLNMTRSSGAFDQNPAWSPDGKHIAWWSDASGEYEIYVQPSDASAEARQLTKRGKGFGYRLSWSPNSEKLAFIDETNTISIIDVESGELKTVVKLTWNAGHGSRFGYSITWSPDSKWLTFDMLGENANSAVYLYKVEEETLHQVTSGFYSDSGPVFSVDGKYLFYLTNRSFSAAYSDMGDGTWIYPNATQLASINLVADAPSLLEVKNDEIAIEEEKGGGEDGEVKEDEETGSGEDGEEEETVSYDLEDLESRLVLLPPDAGNVGDLMPFEGKLVYFRFPNTGSNGGPPSLVFYDIGEREEKTIMANVRMAAPTADGKSLVVRSGNQFGIIKPAPDQKISDPIPTSGFLMDLVPREEWQQIVDDTWRRYRDFFYDPGMQQVDWNAMRRQYGDMLQYARTRWDVSYIQSNMQAELSAGHTYTFGGDTEDVPRRITGYLGIDWDLAGEVYRIKRIVRPAAWDTEIRSSFDVPGIEVSEGDVIHSVNGIALDPEKDPYAAFEGLSGKTVVLRISSSGEMDESEEVIVKCLTQSEEAELRYLEWIEDNRKMVDELSDGKLGYIYMSNTAGQGQLELVRMFYGQLDKKGFIIDERFNGGGQLADRFLELLQRPVVYNLHWRHGKDHPYPTKANPGPMGMLINGWAGSGGDGLPWAFQELEAGPIVGERTLGILVGPATGHQLIDGGGITVPGARLYDNDGHWFWEGEGVAPDIEVYDDPNILMQGRDPQIERVVEEVLKLLEANPWEATQAPPLEDRTARGLKEK